MKQLTVGMARMLPKAELHFHLDGSLRVGTILSLAAAEGVRLPAEEEESLGKLVKVGSHCQSLEEYLAAYAITLSVMQSPQALTRVSYEAFHLCHSDGILYAEARFSPALHTRRGLSYDQILAAVDDGRLQAERQLGIKGGIIVCAMRHNSVEESVELARAAVRNKHRGVVGFDIAGPEKGFPASLFKEAYQVAEQGGLGLTAHAGEGDDWRNMVISINDLHVSRIGHGVHMKDSPETLALVKEKRICIEQCITSNLLTKAVADLASHPAKSFVDNGVMLNLSTDGTLMTDTTLSDEYAIAFNELGFTKKQLLQVIENGFLAAFQPQEVKERMARDAVQKARHILEQLE